MAVRDRFEDLLADEFAKGGLVPGVTGGTEAALLAQKCQEILVAAVRTENAGKAPGEHAAPLAPATIVATESAISTIDSHTWGHA